MICVDSSALLAIVLGEDEAPRCMAVLKGERRLMISAATLAESLIVAGRRERQDDLFALVDGLDFQVVDVTRGSAVGAAQAYGRWGKGRHPAGLNYGDCFAYELARRLNCPLLFVGDDFSKTDIQSAL